MKHQVLVFVGALTAFLIVSCASPSASVSWKPPVLPVKFALDSTGQVTITGEASIVTPVGEFGIDASLPIVSSSQILLILRNRNRGTERRYKIESGRNVKVVTDGHTEIQVGADGIVVIDVTQATVQSIEIIDQTPKASAPVRTGGGNAPSSDEYWAMTLQDTELVIANPTRAVSITRINDIDCSFWDYWNHFQGEALVCGEYLVVNKTSHLTISWSGSHSAVGIVPSGKSYLDRSDYYMCARTTPFNWPSAPLRPGQADRFNCIEKVNGRATQPCLTFDVEGYMLAIETDDLNHYPFESCWN